MADILITHSYFLRFDPKPMESTAALRSAGDAVCGIGIA